MQRQQEAATLQQAEEEAAAREQEAAHSHASSAEEGDSRSEAGSFSSSPASSFSGSLPSMPGSPSGTALAGEGLEQPPEATSSGGGGRGWHGGRSQHGRHARLQRAVTSRGAAGFALTPSSPGREISTHLRVSGAALGGWLAVLCGTGAWLAGLIPAGTRCWGGEGPTVPCRALHARAAPVHERISSWLGTAPLPPCLPLLRQVKKVQELVVAIIQQFTKAYGPLVLVLGGWAGMPSRGPMQAALACTPGGMCACVGAGLGAACPCPSYVSVLLHPACKPQGMPAQVAPPCRRGPAPL